MDKCNSDFFFGMLIATIIIGALMLIKSVFQCTIANDIEDRKVEHLTIKYKNSKQGIADKEMLVNIMKQHFPSSSWSYVDTKAGESHIELDVWNTDKQ